MLEPPSAGDARAYLLEGALFDERPEITITEDAMTVLYDRTRAPIVLRRVQGEDVEATRAEAIDLATSCGRDDIAAAIQAASLALEWTVERSELDEDAWFALHLWQAWLLGRSGGWLYAPDDGIFDPALQRVCADN